MNDKELDLMKIVDIVVDCCATRIDEEGTMSVTKEEVLGKSRAENVVRTRCILCECILYAGYSVTTISQLLHKTQSAVRHLLELASHYHYASRAFRTAESQAKKLCEQM